MGSDADTTVDPQRTPASASGADPYRELFERSTDAILIIEGDMFVECNDAAVRMLRCHSRAEVLRTHPSQLSPPLQSDGRDSFEKANEMIAIAFREGSHRFEWDHRRADGEVFPVEVLLTAVQESDRRILHVVWRDISERRQLEEQLRQAQKLEAIGKLAGGIAHDFNNLLVVVLGHAELLLEQLAARPTEQEHVRSIQRAGAAAADLVRQLLAFSRKQQLIPTTVELNELAQSVHHMLARLIEENILFRVRRAAQPLYVRADRTQLEQVLNNLVVNARDAMPLGGTLTIELDRCSVAGTEAPVEPGTYASVVVSDSGIGMDAETSRRAFEPFFTTKPPGRGTGLGLATAYGIVRQSGGGMNLESSPGNGTKARIWLPLASAPAESPGSGAQATPPSAAVGVGGPATVLVVEDEPAVSEVVRAALERRGYRVLSGRTGREALQLIEEAGAEVRLVITDVIMPGMGGPELVRCLRHRGHKPRVLFMSGYTDDALSSLLDTEDHVHLLTKPFALEELLRRVAEILGRA